MAGKKQYEMLFALNARLNGGFRGTFSRAQAEFTRLGKEIKSLHKVQGDISSYQKQQAALERAKTVAYRMLAVGKYSVEEIADVTELSLEEVKELKKGQSA